VFHAARRAPGGLIAFGGVKWLLLFVGGGLGACLRIALATWVGGRAVSSFPWGTLAVNAAGCFAIGLLATFADETKLLPAGARFFLVAGVLGGFTTFSTFGLETWLLVEDRAYAAALANAFGSLAVGLVAVVAGVLIARQIG
jgi:CrcB protein